MKNYTLFFNHISLNNIPTVGGKNASLGEMINEMSSLGINVPNGFALKTNAYKEFLSINKLAPIIKDTLSALNVSNITELESAAAYRNGN